MTVKNTDIVKFFQKAVKEKWGYVWGLNGVLYTRELAEKYKAQHKGTPNGRHYSTYWTEDCKKWIGKMAADCSGGIVAATSVSMKVRERCSSFAVPITVV